MIGIMICDDEECCLKEIRKVVESNLKLKGIKDIKITTCSSGKELWEKEDTLKKSQVIFLDICMTGKDGIEIAYEIKQKYPYIILVLVTNFIDYALMGYRVEAFRFLLKENLESAMKECISSLLKKLKKDEFSLRFSFEDGERILKVSHIVYIESFKHKMRFHIKGSDRIFQRNGNLTELEKKLSEYGFYRVHKSFLVNMRFVQNLERYCLELENGHKVPIPKEKYQNVREEYFKTIGDI